MCRGQSYDNASNMSGKYSGLQARVFEINRCAPYVPCAVSAHSPTFVGASAAEKYSSSLFCTIVAEIYRFFAAMSLGSHGRQTIQERISCEEIIRYLIVSTS